MGGNGGDDWWGEGAGEMVVLQVTVLRWQW